MKKILFVLLLISSFCRGQQMAFFTTPYAVLIDTTTQIFEAKERGEKFNAYSVYKREGKVKLLDCYDGNLFVFMDTITASDVAQQGSTGIFKITLHSTPLSTTKRCVFLNNVLYQFDNATHELQFSPVAYINYPIKIVNRSTGRSSVEIFSNGSAIFYVLPPPASISALGSGVKKFIIN